MHDVQTPVIDAVVIQTTDSGFQRNIKISTNKKAWYKKPFFNEIGRRGNTNTRGYRRLPPQTVFKYGICKRVTIDLG